MVNARLTYLTDKLETDFYYIEHLLSNAFPVDVPSARGAVTATSLGVENPCIRALDYWTHARASAFVEYFRRFAKKWRTTFAAAAWRVTGVTSSWVFLVRLV